ncbi:membrane fusion protein, multidrug efflux system [Rhizobiales bacterium GAS113]|nr:membrane fusion protein, multidrug efflux system [Rhizobiales bacterium GAS113]
MSDEPKSGGLKELPRADEPAFTKADVGPGGRGNSPPPAAAQPEIVGSPSRADVKSVDSQMIDKIPETDKLGHNEPAIAAERAPMRDLASPSKDMTVAANHSPAPQGERQLAGARVISGEVMPPRRSRKRLVLTAALVAVVGIGGYFGFGWWTHGRFIVSSDDAYVAADMSLLAAKVSGLVTGVDVTDNQHVAAGTVLVRIDDGDYKLAVDAAANRLATQDATVARFGKQIEAQNAAIDQAKAQLASAQAEVVRAQAAFDRAQKLAANEFGTKAALDQARADRDKSTAGIAAAQSALDSASAMVGVLRAQQIEAERSRAELATALDRAKRDLSFTEIRAPFDGVVGNRAVEVGQYVQTGARVMALVPLSTVRVEANLKETQLADVKPGQPVDVRVDAFGSHDIEGRVESVSPASGSLFSLLPPENATGNFTKIVQRLTVRIALPADIVAAGILRPGMSVVVGINTREPGSHVLGEELPGRVALFLEHTKDAALRMFDSVAAAKPNNSGEATKLAAPLR